MQVLKYLCDQVCVIKVYYRARNETAITGPGIDLAHSRLLFISTLGGYLAGEQEPFDAANLLGDYSVCTFSVGIPLGKLTFLTAHSRFQKTRSLITCFL